MIRYEDPRWADRIVIKTQLAYKAKKMHKRGKQQQVANKKTKGRFEK